MTIVEKILAAHAGKQSVTSGEFINVKVDLVMASDLTAHISINQLQALGIRKLFDPSKIVFVMDHFTPNKDVAAAMEIKKMREFARELGVNFIEAGDIGIEHVYLPEKGLVLPGEVVVGGDSHTCTYGALGAFSTGMGSTDIAVAMATGEIWMKVPPTIKYMFNGKTGKWVTGKDLILYTIGQIGVDGALYSAMEFTGEAIRDMSMDGRFTMANMAIEAGAKTGIFEVDEKTLAYAQERANRPFTVCKNDDSDEYAQVIEYNAEEIEPQVALPHSPSNVVPVEKAGDIEVDQVVIGSCTNGRLEDLYYAHLVMQGRKVSKNVRCIVIPGSQKVYLDALRAGYIETFVMAGALVSPPTCGPCVGGHMGILAAGERCASTTNRNFQGRMGDPRSEIYLVNPAVAAASAITGKITNPKEVMGNA
ncbi:3-isopropylmalate dehydratase, large subunit [Desulfoscipio gibsoniae DSM 7213]|uniref:3-isopropylmalate dehydratase large subunit n=2 Tax=Desulfoscipio gibsoniae TaxID=102134 RepID=R4KFT8_9FIRM|nr:3-isopropylmalate dehydratase, large subunit [Desulfoscipio gibsoniae DSM 7213]